MKTLKDYDLIRGDWVKLEKDDKWKEFQSTQYQEEYYYFFETLGGTKMDSKVEAVLRPSIIIRDELNRFLGYAVSYLGETANEMITFKQVHPKEEKGSLYEQLKSETYCMNCEVINEDATQHIIKGICAEIDKLKNKENEG